VNPLDFLPVAVVRLGDFCVPFFGLIESLLRLTVVGNRAAVRERNARRLTPE
jgi:hypothetical protein